MTMDFSMFYEIQIPEPSYPGVEHQTFKQVIAQIVEAEAAGFGYVWAVEHHFRPGFSHCSAPEVLYGALSQCTSKIRIGHGVRLLPFPYNHPIRAAEMGATLDLLCDGRMEFGTGRSATKVELEGFGINPDETRALWEEALDIVVGAWTNEVFSWEGRYFKIPPRRVVPKPFQKPHPPLWCAATMPDTHETAGRKGLGLLSFTLLVDLEELKRRIAIYRAALAEARPPGGIVNDRAAVFTMVHCAETNAEARRNAAESIEWYAKTAFNEPGRYERTTQAMGLDPAKLTFDYMDGSDMVICGDPDTCIKKVRRYQEAGCQQLMCFMQIHSIPHQKVMDSIKLWGKHVIPYFV
jgi:alkanesulfonate monooxygenase SsuD/methylene tetrahydromethanopterin reductase-like flavin-dependent oxidoreductase (luciferase family)